ncbi:MAG: MnmC family methyltransferase [Vulcanococcus sp.]
MSGCRPDPPVCSPATSGDTLHRRATADGSLTLWSERFGEAFHSGLGAHAEAIAKFVAPAQLERFPTGQRLRVLDVCVGLGYNSAALVEAAEDRGLQIAWIGLELDPRPLGLALADEGFRRLWRTSTLEALEQLHRDGHWGVRGDGHGEGHGNDQKSSGGSWLLGDARAQLAAVLERWEGRCDLVLHDAFSPTHCPELWTLEFLGALARLLNPRGRLLTYCAAAAVRQALQQAGLQLASIVAASSPDSSPAAERAGSGDPPRLWCAGTAASPTPFQGSDDTAPCHGAVLRALSAMEREHLLSRAGEPYRDPSGNADAATIRSQRSERQRHHTGESTSAWRRRWGLER